MSLLAVEFVVVIVIGWILEWFVDPVATFSLAEFPPFGHAFVPVYLWISVRLFQYFVRRETPARRRTFAIAYLYKLLFTFIMTYLLINAYSFGDFFLYYTFPYWGSEQLRTFRWEALANVEIISGRFFRNTGLDSTSTISYTFMAIFVILPPSLYGLAFLSGTVIFLACLKMYTVLEPHIAYKRLFIAVFFFSPSMTLQLGYTGKETLIIPLIAGLIVFSYRHTQAAARLLLLFSVFYIRFYQAFFLVLAWIGSRLTMRQLVTARALPVFLAAIVVSAFILRIAAARLEQFGMELGLDFFITLGKFLSIQYGGASLVLKPFPMPFTFMQPFRPLPWEAHNALALITSLEMFALLILAIYLLAARYRPLLERFHYDKFFRFLAIYVFIQFLIFSHIDNMGDLVRRKIYFIPLLFGLLCYARMTASDVLAAKAARLRGRHVKRRPVPAGAGTPPGSAAPPHPG